jgi:transmembrane 9 superfamily protein 2/4
VEVIIIQSILINSSINHEIKENGDVNLLCAKNQHEFESRMDWQLDNFFKIKGKQDVVYSYDVIFIDSPTKWSSRWDHYMLSHKDDNIHWLSFLNSTIVILIFTILLAHIFCRSLKRDIDYINTVSNIFKNN